MKTIIFLMLAGLFIVAGCSQYGKTAPQPIPQPETVTETEETPEIETPSATHTIEITRDGFNPSTSTISKGDTVNFINKQAIASWPASAVHPTHKVYPGSDINKCDTAEQSDTFDACRRLSQEETFSFTFNERGNWRYHDHLNPTTTGTITVQ